MENKFCNTLRWTKHIRVFELGKEFENNKINHGDEIMDKAWNIKLEKKRKMHDAFLIRYQKQRWFFKSKFHYDLQMTKLLSFCWNLSELKDKFVHCLNGKLEIPYINKS